jgi:hypothetical protein
MPDNQNQKLTPSQEAEAQKALQHGQEFMELIKTYIDFPRWGFEVSLTDYSRWGNPIVIFNSEYCRVSFRFAKQRLRIHDEMIIRYGRRHAPDHAVSISWQGEEYLCWHHYRWRPIEFLDGLTPQEAVDQEEWPPVAQAFRDSDEGKQLVEDYWPKLSLQLQTILWEHYGERLFELFDLRRPDLWEEYRKFVEDYYKIMNYKPLKGDPFPPFQKIC